jgi:hypothetical protein
MKRNTLTALLVGLLLPICGIARAQGPVAGQRYQIPAGYESYGAGTLINYGGFNYVIQGDGTMLLAQQTGDTSTDPGPPASQPYQVPAGYESYAAGTLISYGGFNYVIQSDGTMLLQQDGDSSVAVDYTDGPVPDQPYQIPADFAGSAPGSVISYGGSSYAIQSDGTMLLQQPGGFGYSSFYSQPGTSGSNWTPGVSNNSSNFPPGVVTNGRPGPTFRPGGQTLQPGNRPGGVGYRPGPANTGYRPGPANTGYRPGPANTGYRPGPANTGYRPGPVNTGYRPGPANTGYRPMPGNTVSRPGPVNRPTSPGYHPGPSSRPSNGGFRPSGGGFRPSGGGSRPSGGSFRSPSMGRRR